MGSYSPHRRSKHRFLKSTQDVEHGLLSSVHSVSIPSIRTSSTYWDIINLKMPIQKPHQTANHNGEWKNGIIINE